MNQTELNKILEEHAKWLKNPSEGKRAKLYKANLSYAHLFRANLSESYLYRADLSKANLTKANLSKSNLSGADLSGANLSRANLSYANLYKVNLSGANLKDITFNYVYLSECNYENFINQAELTEYFLVKPCYAYVEYILYKDFSLLEEVLKSKSEIIRIVRNN